MLDQKWISLNVCMVGIAISSAALFSSRTSFASAAPSHLEMSIQVSQVQGQEIGERSALEGLMQTFNQRRQQREGIRRSGLCVMSPSIVETDVIWSDRPLFLWQGAAEQITVNKLGSSEVLWNQPIDPQTRQVLYNGTALQPGEIYQWELTGASDIKTSLIFQVMETDKRNQIAAQLQAIEAQLKADGASQEIIELQQAQYFADQGLWSDALQQLYSIGNSSPDAVQAIQQIESSLCGS